MQTFTKPFEAVVLDAFIFAEDADSPALRGNIGMKIKLIRGSIAVGARTFLRATGKCFESRVTGVEILTDLSDPQTLVVHISKPQDVTLSREDLLAARLEGLSVT